jgi:hypothetical protein
VLDLAPDNEREVPGQHEQREQDGPEAQPGQATLPHPLLAGAATRSMEPVRTIDRPWIDWRRVLDGIRAPGRLGHAEDYKWVG